MRASSLNVDDPPNLVVLGYVLDPSGLEAVPVAVAVGNGAWWVRDMRVHFGVETAFLYAATDRGGPQFAVVEVQSVP